MLSKRKIALLILPFCLAFTGCSEREVKEPVPGIEVELRRQFSEADFARSIQAEFQLLRQDEELKTLLTDLDTIEAFYAANGFKPHWIKQVEFSDDLTTILKHISKAEDHAFDPEAYHRTAITKSIFSSLKHCVDHGHLDYQALARTEILTSEAVVKYAAHLQIGRTNPKRLYGSSYQTKYDSVVDRYAPFNQDNVQEFLADIQPKGVMYAALQKAYKEEKAKLGKQQHEPIRMRTKKIEPGDTSKILNLIATRLIQLGDLDSTDANFKTYDSVLVNAVMVFQEKNQLHPDGVIGKRTIRYMNITPEEKVELIALNLERLRWHDYPADSAYIMVNIPAFKLAYYHGDSVVKTMRTCVGHKRTSTPEMQGKIAYMVLNPTWSVPKSIARNEMIRKIKKDPNYLKKHNYNVYKNGKRVSGKRGKMGKLFGK